MSGVGRTKRSRTASATAASRSLETFWLQEKTHTATVTPRAATAMGAELAGGGLTAPVPNMYTTPQAAPAVEQCLALARHKRSKRRVAALYPSEADEQAVSITQADLEDLAEGSELSDCLVDVCLRQFRDKLHAPERCVVLDALWLWAAKVDVDAQHEAAKAIVGSQER